MPSTVFMFGTRTHYLFIICTLLCLELRALNQFISDGETYWNSTSDFIPIQNASYGTIQLKTGFYMEFNIEFHGKSLDHTWENIFRIGHPGHLYSDFKCSKNDRYPAMWIDDDSNAFVFDISDAQNCFRQYGNHRVDPHTLYKIIIHYNSSWIYIQINNEIVTNQPRANRTDITQLGTDLHLYISTVTSAPANVTLSNIIIRSYDDTSQLGITTTSQPTMLPSITPTITPTLTPTSTPTVSKAPTKRPTTFLPTIFIPHTSYSTTDDDDNTAHNVRMNTTDFVLPATVLPTASSTILAITNMDMTQFDVAQADKTHDGLSFEVIFYILTGCAMGGILFCVCTCCCFGCIINKKIKNLASHDDEESHDEEEEEDMIDKKCAEGAGMDALNVHGSKLRVHTVSADQTTDESMMIVSHEPETITRSPTINRLSSPSSAMSGPTFHPPSTSSVSITGSPKTPLNKTPESISISTNVASPSFVNLDSKSSSNRPKFTQKFHKRLTKLKENDEQQHKLRMTHSVPIMDPKWNIQIERSGSPTREDTVIEIETEKTLPSGEDEDTTQRRIVHSSSSHAHLNSNNMVSISPLHLSAQYDSNHASYFDSLYSKNTSSKYTQRQPLTVYSNPSTNMTNYSLFVHKPRSPLILDMNEVNINEEHDAETETETETQLTQHSGAFRAQAPQQSKTSSKHYQIQIDYANSEQSTTNTHNKRTPHTTQSFDVKSIGDIEMDMNSTHKGKNSPPDSPSHELMEEEEEELKAERLYSDCSDANTRRNSSFNSMRRSNKSIEIDIEEAINNIEAEEEDNGVSNTQGGPHHHNTQSTNAKEFLQLPYNDSNISRLSNSSNYSNSSASSSATSCSSSSCSSSSSSNSDSTSCSSSSSSSDSSSMTRCTTDGHHTLNTGHHGDDMTSNISGSSAYYSNATHSYVD